MCVTASPPTYLLPYTRENDQKRQIHGGEHHTNRHDGDIARDGGTIRERVKRWRSVIAERVKPALHCLKGSYFE